MAQDHNTQGTGRDARPMQETPGDPAGCAPARWRLSSHHPHVTLEPLPLCAGAWDATWEGWCWEPGQFGPGPGPSSITPPMLPISDSRPARGIFIEECQFTRFLRKHGSKLWYNKIHGWSVQIKKGVTQEIKCTIIFRVSSINHGAAACNSPFLLTKTVGWAAAYKGRKRSVILFGARLRTAQPWKICLDRSDHLETVQNR